MTAPLVLALALSLVAGPARVIRPPIASLQVRAQLSSAGDAKAPLDMPPSSPELLQPCPNLLAGEADALPQPIVAEPLPEVLHFGPINVSTLALPDGIELPQPLELSPPAAAAAQTTKLPSLRELATFCLPTLGIWLSSPLLSLIDTSVVGVTCATHHLAALAPSTKLCDYVAYFLSVLGMATTNLAADALAHDEPHRAKRIVASSLVVALGLGAAVAVAMYYSAGTLMTMMLGPSAASAASAPLLSAAAEYTAIRSLGYPAALLTMVLQAAFIATTDATTPLLAVPVTALANLAGDLLFVAPMGAAGAAWATTGALYANALTLLACWRRKMRMLGGEDVLLKVPSGPELRQLGAFALPLMAATIARVYMGLSITLSAVALGTTALAANQVIESLYWLFCPFGEAISLCMQAYLPPLLLKGRSLARRLQGSALKAAGALGAFAAACALALPLALPHLFTSSAPVRASMALAAPALGFALLTYVLSSAAEGMLIARKQLRVLAFSHVANTLALSLALRAALRLPRCGLQHVWLLFGTVNVLRTVEFFGLLRHTDRAAVEDHKERTSWWRLSMRSLRPRVAAARARRREELHDAIPDVAEIASHLV